MKRVLVDTDILSFFFRNDPRVLNHCAAYSKEHVRINLSIITFYEIVSGLKHRNASRQLEVFLEFSTLNTVLPVTQNSATISAEWYARLRKGGKPIDDIDLLIAGIALSNGLSLATHNISHFERIAGLDIVDWSTADNPT